jgi:serine/threonine protein kinase
VRYRTGEILMMLQPGSRPLPDYLLIRELGAGAFGQVWHARGPGGLDVALKFVLLKPPIDALEWRSLESVKSIRHPNLVSLFGAWHKDDWLILAMELCDRTLQDRLAEAVDKGLPGIPPDELLRYMTDAANGLDALTARQVQHRDVKPANLLLLGSGVKVADFGLAKALEHTEGSNSGAGTLFYTAPECFKRKLTQQSDQYSLAVTYYHLRMGDLLFKGNRAEVTYAHLETEPDLSGLPPAEAVVLSRALSKEPGKRWPSCKEFVKKLIDMHKAMRLTNNALFYYVRGMERLNRDDNEAIKDLHEAIRLFDAATRLDGNKWLAYLFRGKARLATDYGKAIKDFDNAIKCHKQRLEKLRELNAPDAILTNELQTLHRLESTREDAARALADDAARNANYWSRQSDPLQAKSASGAP